MEKLVSNEENKNVIILEDHVDLENFNPYDYINLAKNDAEIIVKKVNEITKSDVLFNSNLSALYSAKKFNDAIAEQMKKKYDEFNKAYKDYLKTFEETKNILIENMPEKFDTEVKLGNTTMIVPVSASEAIKDFSIVNLQDYKYDETKIPKSIEVNGVVHFLFKEVKEYKLDKKLVKDLCKTGIEIPGVSVSDKKTLAQR